MDAKPKLSREAQIAHRYTNIRKACAKTKGSGCDGERENLATLCANAWVRTNFPHKNSPNIAEKECREDRLVVHLSNGEDVELYFPNEDAARQAMEKIPPATGKYARRFRMVASEEPSLPTATLLGKFMLADGVDLQSLTDEMNRTPSTPCKQLTLKLS